MSWPPTEMAPIFDRLAEWDAWLSGDRARLESNGTTTSTALVNYESVGSKISRIWRRFWGATDPGTAGPKIKIHIPLAADIARASADLLFAEPPEITSESVPTAERLAGYMTDGLIQLCSAAAEICAGLGGVFLRVNWDLKDQKAFLTMVDADMALPVFAFGKLTSVRFWRVVKSEGNTVWRHVETHELDNNGFGVIRHELFQGTPRDLGNLVTIAESDVTKDIPVDEDGVIQSGSPGLCAVYVPNVLPNTLWRTHSVGQHLGLPDIAGSEDLHDRLDHTNSALLREVDLGKARITVPESMLDVLQAGQGTTWDSDREIFTTLNVEQSSPAAELKLFQPNIRVDEHLRVMQQLTEDALRHAGYSAQTFGEDETGGQATATEVTARDRRSKLTRSRKLRHWHPGLLVALKKMLAVELVLGWAPGVDPETVTLTFPEPAGSSALENAQTVQLLDAAGAISLRRKVEMANPEWEMEQVDAEMAAISGEVPVVPDGESFGQNGAGINPGDGQQPTE